MFTGTLVYRAEAGQVAWWKASAAACAVLAMTIGGGMWQGAQHPQWSASSAQWQWQWVTSLAGAALTFGLGLWLRHRRVPKPLAWLGLISYSLYLLHPVLIEVYDSVPWTRNQNFVPTELLLVAVFVLVLLVCCGLTHRLIEAPMQRLGRRVARRLDVRFGPDTVASQPDGTQ
jgi:peptidoglycan/LPS O-acetylase OafA/YrhL